MTIKPLQEGLGQFASVEDQAVVLADLFIAMHGVGTLRKVLATKTAKGTLDDLDRAVLSLINSPDFHTEVN